MEYFGTLGTEANTILHASETYHTRLLFQVWTKINMFFSVISQKNTICDTVSILKLYSNLPGSQIIFYVYQQAMVLAPGTQYEEIHQAIMEEYKRTDGQMDRWRDGWTDTFLYSLILLLIVHWGIIPPTDDCWCHELALAMFTGLILALLFAFALCILARSSEANTSISNTAICDNSNCIKPQNIHLISEAFSSN